jgi:MtN3 and saliva related transmembrane protein
VWKTWGTRSAEDISFLMLFLHITGMVLWGTYGFLMGAGPIVVANAIAIVLDVVLIVLKMRAPGEYAVSPPQRSKV